MYVIQKIWDLKVTLPMRRRKNPSYKDHAERDHAEREHMNAHLKSNRSKQLIPMSPSVFGPGTWWLCHRRSYLTDSIEKVPQFMDFFRDVVANIPCMTCRKNAYGEMSKYDESYYMDEYHDSRFVGMFVWMSDFHNQVNKRNYKKNIDWKDAYKEYKKANRKWEPQVYGHMNSSVSRSGGVEKYGVEKYGVKKYQTYHKIARTTRFKENIHKVIITEQPLKEITFKYKSHNGSASYEEV